MASNTGCTSDGELAITLRMSAVAVCRSSASCVSLNSRAFSIAITAWSAKVWSSSTCGAARTRPARARVTPMMPIALPLAGHRGRHSMLRKPLHARNVPERLGASTDRSRCPVSGQRLAAAATMPEGLGIRRPAAGKAALQRFVGGSARRREGREMDVLVDEREAPRSRSHRDSRFALSAMASNTGCTSDGELAITFRMSAVAVCRSSASWVSLNSRAFSIAITAWSAKVCSRSMSIVARTAGLAAG